MIKEYVRAFIYSSLFVLFMTFILNLFLPNIRSLPSPFILNGSLSKITSAVVYFWTVIVLFIYTIETYRLRKESQNQVEATKRQTEVQQRPFVIFETIDANIMEGSVVPYFRNIGNGIAFNIKIRDGHFTIKDRHIIDSDKFSQYTDAYEFTYDRVGHILQKDCRLEIDIKYCDMVAISEGFTLPSNKFEVLDVKHASTLYRAIIEFQNIEMQWYYVEQVTSPEGIEIMNSGPLHSLR